MSSSSEAAHGPQIRAQLGALGLPLLGDTMYAALAARADRAQHASSPNSTSSSPPAQGQSQAKAGSDSSMTGAESKAAEGQALQAAFNAANRWLNEPGREGIGLQACKLVVSSESDLMGASPATFEARTPWWREAPSQREHL